MRLTKRFSGFTAAFAMLTLAGCSDKATEESPAESATLADSDETSLESDNRDNDLYVAGPKRSGTLEIDAANLAYLYHRMSGEPASVVRMMTETGSPLSWPRSVIKAMRPMAIIASWQRWAGLR